jgi:hypothetical protein
MSTQSFNAPSLSGMQATLSKLQIPPASFAFSNQPWIIAPKDASAPGPGIEEQLKDMLLAAHSVSESMMIGSVLAGPSSETDEFADVALWIPGSASDEPKDVLHTLGMSSWADDASLSYFLYGTLIDDIPADNAHRTPGRYPANTHLRLFV